MVDSARARVVALAARQHHAFTRKQATEAGFDKRRVATGLRAGWLLEPIRGVLTLANSRPSWERSLMTVVFAGGGHAVVSHRSAARLHELDGFVRPTNAVIEVSLSRRFRLDPPVPAVIHHVTPLDAVDIVTVKGFPCVTRERALTELGSVVSDPQLVRQALTSARRKGVDLERLRSCTDRLHRPGQRGTGVLMRLLHAIPWEGQLPATWFEELLALCLDDPSLPEMTLQHPIRNAAGRIIARVDIAFPSVTLGLEGHSRQFHFGPTAEALDEDRDLAAALCGWELIYLGWYATRRPVEVLRAVKDLIAIRR